MSKKTSTPKSHLSPKSPHVRTVVVLSGRDLKSRRDRFTGISNRLAHKPNFNIVDLYGIQQIPHEFTQADAVIIAPSSPLIGLPPLPKCGFSNSETKRRFPPIGIL